MISFIPKEFYMAKLVDKYYKRPHKSSSTNARQPIEMTQPKTVGVDTQGAQIQTFSPTGDPVIVECTSNDSPHSSQDRIIPH